MSRSGTGSGVRGSTVDSSGSGTALGTAAEGVRPADRMPYGGSPLDRAPRLRESPEAVAELLDSSTTRVVPVWRDRFLRDTHGLPAVAVGRAARRVTAAASDVVFLGLDDADAVFAADVSDLPEHAVPGLADAEGTVDLRAVFSALPGRDAAVLAHARGIVHWARRQRFCGSCGTPTTPRSGGTVRACGAAECGRLLFPRIEPAVIVLVESSGRPRRCLLGRHRGAAPDAFATLAGFVEVGENLEDAVRRELAEEAGVRVCDLRYQASQAWPFPSGLMVGFFATAVDETVHVDGDELAEARWFTRSEVARLVGSGRRDSIEHALLTTWLRSAC